MSQDVLQWHVESDGTITIKTEGVSEENHLSADEFLAELAKLTGGSRTTTQRIDVSDAIQLNHQHHHGHEHHTH